MVGVPGNGQTAGMPGVAMKKRVQGRSPISPLEGEMSAKPTEGGVHARVAIRLDHPPLPCRASPPQGGRLAASAPHPFSPPGTERGAKPETERGVVGAAAARHHTWPQGPLFPCNWGEGGAAAPRP